ncbi:MAG TPA: hypothetical protein VNT54_07260 [Solirubrobacteraceae bacterium]|nr:hypothetical protein [Solirubrobacteraceae bacterium]
MTEAAVTSGSRRFRVVQFEFPWELGPQDGRYTIREHLGEAPGHVLVLRTLGAPERRLLAARRARARLVQAPPDPPAEPVVTSRATLVDTAALDGYESAARWLADADVGALAHEALARLNRVLHAHRIAAADPRARDVALRQALVVRVGFGDGERVAEGRWERARELPRQAAGGLLRARAGALRPQERLAALLAGRDAALACEELTLRARLDVEAERWREAALGLRVALETAIAELEPWRDAPGLAQRLEELRGRRRDVAAAAAAALQGGLDDEQIALVEAALGRVEAALRARVATGGW